jgi:regulatory protein
MTKTFVVKSLRQRALDYLAKREYSYVELGKKLKAYAEENDDIPALLDDFKARGWLSDQRFTEQIIHARKAKFGTAKIAHELREKGIADHLITGAVETLKATELDSATEVWRKKFKPYPQSREEWSIQPRFLQSRCIGFELIKKILTVNDND